jgi:hypothetical protein
MGIEKDEIYARLQESYQEEVKKLVDAAVDQLHKELAKLED